MIRAVILGATGSIGTTALGAIREHRLPIKIAAVSAHSKESELEKLKAEFDCPAFLTSRENEYRSLMEFLHSGDADIVLNGIAGFAGLEASVRALEGGKDLALANKESVVCGSSFLFEIAKKNNSSIIPVDSEHSAIYELLKTRDSSEVDKLVITASGGPFRKASLEEMQTVTVEKALNHPTWKMGPKITIDSATLANKAMEVIEAHGLFGFQPEKIEVAVHPQSVVHSMIGMKNGSLYAQLGYPDMSIPIISALMGECTAPLIKPLDFTNLSLSFEKPDLNRFPLLNLAWKIIRRGGDSALAFNASDEVAVHAFLKERIPFLKIQDIVTNIVEESSTEKVRDLKDAIERDRFYRARAWESCF